MVKDELTKENFADQSMDNIIPRSVDHMVSLLKEHYHRENAYIDTKPIFQNAKDFIVRKIMDAIRTIGGYYSDDGPILKPLQARISNESFLTVNEQSRDVMLQFIRAWLDLCANEVPNTFVL